MPHAVAFKSGKDIGKEPVIEDEDTVACVDCGTTETQERAYDGGWQLEPPVCPNCLRWQVVGGDACCHGAQA